ncbi:S-adenosylmethionine decarboxylase [Paucibacter sp. AS339]|uniref:S-adenosylmethionine decarboxylase family protein n=1 Tax=Paucibacter hankyongi TaxID=3133434 RepID=UPI003097987C
MQGLHLTADLRGVRADLPVMLEPAALRELCVAAVVESGLGAVAELFHRFTPLPVLASGAASTAANDPAIGSDQSGITGVVLLAESHLAVHTWPELGGVTLDVYVCNLGADNSTRAEALMNRLCSAFAAEHVKRQSLRRG